MRKYFHCNISEIAHCTWFYCHLHEVSDTTLPVTSEFKILVLQWKKSYAKHTRCTYFPQFRVNYEPQHHGANLSFIRFKSCKVQNELQQRNSIVSLFETIYLLSGSRFRNCQINGNASNRNIMQISGMGNKNVCSMFMWYKCMRTACIIWTLDGRQCAVSHLEEINAHANLYVFSFASLLSSTFIRSGYKTRNIRLHGDHVHVHYCTLVSIIESQHEYGPHWDSIATYCTV